METSSAQGAESMESGRRRFVLPPALRYPLYRNYWLGLIASVNGFQVLMFGQYWLVYELTGSPLYLGYTGMAHALPAMLLNLVGGMVADKLDKRRLIFFTGAASSSLVFLLAVLVLFHLVQVWHVIVLALFTGAINAFNQPARYALYPHLIDRKVLMNAVALNSVVWQSARIIGPAIAGGLIAFFGTAAAFFFAGGAMFTFALVVQRLRIPRIENRATGHPLLEILEGLKFIRDNTIFLCLMAIAFFNSFFAMAYVTQMPIFARDILEVGANGQGILLSISGIGALTNALWLGSKGNFRHKGLVLIGGAAMTGLSVAGFALTAEYVGSFSLAGLFMLAIGVFTNMCMISITTSLQVMVPDTMRGRVMGIYGMSWNIMPLGGMYAGVMAGFIGTPFAVALGGLLTTVFAIGPALINKQVRNLGPLITKAEEQMRVQ